MTTLFILVSLLAVNSQSIQTTFIESYTTSTACENAAAALRQGRDMSRGQVKKYECVHYDGGK